MCHQKIRLVIVVYLFVSSFITSSAYEICRLQCKVVWFDTNHGVPYIVVCSILFWKHHCSDIFVLIFQPYIWQPYSQTQWTVTSIYQNNGLLGFSLNVQLLFFFVVFFKSIYILTLVLSLTGVLFYGCLFVKIAHLQLYSLIFIRHCISFNQLWTFSLASLGQRLSRGVVINCNDGY